MNNKIKWSIGLLALLAVAFFLMRNGNQPGDAGTSQIETTTLETGDINRAVATSGAVRPLITVEVVVLPAASRATAVNWWAPLVAEVLNQVAE